MFASEFCIFNRRAKLRGSYASEQGHLTEKDTAISHNLFADMGHDLNSSAEMSPSIAYLTAHNKRVQL